MQLSDVIAAAGLSGWAEAGLLLFFVAFVTIALYTFARRNREQYERLRFLPLTDEEAPSTGIAPEIGTGGRR